MTIARFIGEWGKQKRDELYRVLSEIEQLIDAPVPKCMTGKQWVCGCYREGTDTVYTASRVNVSQVVVDYDLAGLIEQLERLPCKERPMHDASLATHVR